MIKILSFVLFVTAFIWTWCMFNSPAPMGIETHAGIQSKLTLLIEDNIKTKRPSMTNFRLNKMFTEKIDETKVKAYFSYQYDDVTSVDEDQKIDLATQNVTGEAILIKGLSEDPAVQKWILQSVTTGNESLEFKEGITIISEPESATENK